MVHRPSSLYLFIKSEIEALITSGRLKAGDRLPSEHDLARKFAVSRMTLREALRTLEEEGVLAKKHGLGTFIKASPPRIKSILDMNYGVTEMIQNMGFRPGTKERVIKESRADASLGQILAIADGSKVITLERVRTANKRPVVYSRDMISQSILSGARELKGLEESLYEFLETKCGIVLSSGTAKLFPTKADRKLAAKLHVKINTPLFYLEQLDTDSIGRPVLYSQEYFVSDYFDFIIYRRRKK